MLHIYDEVFYHTKARKLNQALIYRFSVFEDQHSVIHESAAPLVKRLSTFLLGPDSPTKIPDFNKHIKDHKLDESQDVREEYETFRSQADRRFIYINFEDDSFKRWWLGYLAVRSFKKQGSIYWLGHWFTNIRAELENSSENQATAVQALVVDVSR